MKRTLGLDVSIRTFVLSARHADKSCEHQRNVWVERMHDAHCMAPDLADWMPSDGAQPYTFPGADDEVDRR